ncbi:MAG: efflux RND transporter periplasmic adaptor subunit [Lentisphaerales bacterium]|nr:efflux RND transporter periplasmic adaptor subunit [Lentisphaerales bacterium]
MKNIILTLCATLALTACKEKVQKRPAPPAPEVLVTTATSEEMSRSQTIIGQTKAFADIQLKTKVEGYITEVGFKDGGAVSKGDILFKIDDRPYIALKNEASAKVMQTKAAMIEAKSKYERTQKLHKKGAVSDQDLDNAFSEFKAAEAAIASAEAELEFASLNLEYTKIKAPIDGKMAIGHISEGNYVTPLSGALAQLVSLTPIYVDVNISEKLVMSSLMKNLKKGESLLEMKKDQVWEYHLILSNDTNYEHVGKLDSFDNQVNATTGTVKFRLEFPNPDYLLAPNQYVKLVLKSKEKESNLIIPQAAIMSDQTGDFVYLVNDENKAIRTPVVVGKRFGTKATVEKGLKGGEKIIFQGTQKARPGSPVVPKDTPMPIDEKAAE